MCGALHGAVSRACVRLLDLEGGLALLVLLWEQAGPPRELPPGE